VSQRAAALAICCTLVTLSAVAFADTQHLRVGDALTYDLTIQVQERASSGKSSSSREIPDMSAGAGTARIDVASVTPDGTANGTLSVDLVGFSHGAPIVVHKSVAVQVANDGEIKPAASIEPLLDQMIVLANRSIADLASRAVRPGQSWQWLMQAQDYPMTIALDRVARGQQLYQGLPTLIVQSTGGGQHASDADPVQAAISLAGTDYYDQRDALLVGEAMRSDTLVSDASSNSTLDSSTLMTIQLRAFARAARAQPSPSAPPAVEAPAAQYTPTPLPTAYGPAPLPTVTPRPI